MNKDWVEIEAVYEENYHSAPVDKFIMSRATCALRAMWFPGHPFTQEELYTELLTKCENRVKSYIAKEQARMEASAGNDGF